MKSLTKKKIQFSGLVLRSSQILRVKKAFTLIEVLVASLILSTVFFALLTLISNNTRQAINLTHYRTMDNLFLSSKTCISSLWYAYLSGVTASQSVNFGTDNLGCFTGGYDTNLSFTGISLARSVGTETGETVFWNYFSVLHNTGSLRIYDILNDGTETNRYDFLVVP